MTREMTREMTIGDVKSLCEKLAKPHGFTVRDVELKDRPKQYWDVELAKEPGVTVVGTDSFVTIWWDDGYWVYSLVYSKHTYSIPRGHADAEQVVEWAFEAMLGEYEQVMTTSM